MKRKYVLALLAIITIASVLRLWKLDEVPVSLFGDELDVGYHAYSLGLTGKDYSGNQWPLQLHSIAEWRTPLYIYSAIPTVMLFGITAWGVRLPAAIFGILGVWMIYLLSRKMTGKESVGLLAALVLAISPWHIQYSRAGFEVTQMLFFMLAGLFSFLISMEKKGKWLWVSILCFMLMPWIYNSAKLFTVLLLTLLAIIYRKEVFLLRKKQLGYAVITGLILGVPLIVNIITGEGSQRFGYVSIFNTQEAETHVGQIRGLDASLEERIFHNKYTYWGNQILGNYFQSFSTDTLFTSGDTNPRHSIDGMGLLYRAEIIPLFVGLVLFFKSKIDLKIKLLISLTTLAAALPSAITTDGGNHATRLILILPGLVFLIAYGLSKFSKIALAAYAVLLMICFLFYQHNYWHENSINAENWWHAGWHEAVQAVKAIDQEYERVYISMRGEPAYIFFAAHYPLDPSMWQKVDPVSNKTTLPGVGEVSFIDKYYFADVGGGLYDWGNNLTSNDIYLVPASIVHVNVYAGPERVPENLRLIKAIPSPAGNPAFYIFSGIDEE